ncbi:MAG: hypothetical protein KDB61_10485, partial [Planctomycetes bacterium]|nr:hypothetical protein [Planctomycetota bacterium]
GSYPAEIRLTAQTGGSADVYLAYNLVVSPAQRPVLRVQPVDGVTIFTDVNGSADALDGEITIENSGNQNTTWGATSHDNWVRIVPPGERDIQPGDIDTLSIYIKESAMTQLGPGIHLSQVDVFDENDPTVTYNIPITVHLAPSSLDRIEDGLIAEYLFEEGTGDVVHDTSGNSPALDLHIQDPANVAWQPSGLRLNSPTLLATPGAATRMTESIRLSSELTVEAWLRPENLEQDGPARLIGISNGPSLRNFTLAQGLWGGQPKDTFNMRLRNSGSDLDGMPLISTNPGSASLGMQHVVYTRTATGRSTVYVNGVVAQGGTNLAT